MSEAVTLALIVVLGQVVAGFFMWLNNRTLSAKVEVIRHQTNSINTKMEEYAYKAGGDDERANPTAEKPNAK